MRGESIMSHCFRFWVHLIKSSLNQNQSTNFPFYLPSQHWFAVCAGWQVSGISPNLATSNLRDRYNKLTLHPVPGPDVLPVSKQTDYDIGIQSPFFGIFQSDDKEKVSIHGHIHSDHWRWKPPDCRRKSASYPWYKPDWASLPDAKSNGNASSSWFAGNSGKVHGYCIHKKSPSACRTREIRQSSLKVQWIRKLLFTQLISFLHNPVNTVTYSAQSPPSISAMADTSHRLPACIRCRHDSLKNQFQDTTTSCRLPIFPSVVCITERTNTN